MKLCNPDKGVVYRQTASELKSPLLLGMGLWLHVCVLSDLREVGML